MTTTRLSISLVSIIAGLMLSLLCTATVFAGGGGEADPMEQLTEINNSTDTDSFTESYIDSLIDTLTVFLSVIPGIDGPNGGGGFGGFGDFSGLDDNFFPALSTTGILSAAPAAPSEGNTPLTVAFTSLSGDDTDFLPSNTSGRDTLIDFGDGTPPQWMQCNQGTNDTTYTINDVVSVVTDYTVYLADGTVHEVGVSDIFQDINNDQLFEDFRNTGFIGSIESLTHMSEGNLNAGRYSFSDIQTVSLELFDDSASVLNITLNDGTGYTISVPDTVGLHNENRDAFYLDILETGYTGSVSTLLNTANNTQFALAPEGNSDDCVLPIDLEHSYASEGTYTVQLVREGGYCNNAVCSDIILDEILVTVGQTTDTADPVFADGNNAEFVEYTLGIPATMTPGETTHLAVAFQNTGTTDWSFDDQYKIGSQNTQDNTDWGLNRVDMDVDDIVEPGDIYEFIIDVTAPTTEGTYNFQWQMIEEFEEWFGEASPNFTIDVVADDAVIDNTISFEVSVSAAGNQTAIDWTTDDITMTTDAYTNNQASFRWESTGYSRCLLFLADNGNYSLTRGYGEPLTSGDTGTEGFDVYERTGDYTVQCSKIEDGVEVVQERTIHMTVDQIPPPQDADDVPIGVTSYGKPDLNPYTLQRSVRSPEVGSPVYFIAGIDNEGSVNSPIYRSRFEVIDGLGNNVFTNDVYTTSIHDGGIRRSIHSANWVPASPGEYRVRIFSVDEGNAISETNESNNTTGYIQFAVTGEGHFQETVIAKTVASVAAKTVVKSKTTAVKKAVVKTVAKAVPEVRYRWHDTRSGGVNEAVYFGQPGYDDLGSIFDTGGGASDQEPGDKSGLDGTHSSPSVSKDTVSKDTVSKDKAEPEDAEPGGFSGFFGFDPDRDTLGNAQPDKSGPQ